MNATQQAPDELVLSVSAFKARCLDLFARLDDGRLRCVTVTKRGRPLAIVISPPAEQPLQRVFENMQGSVIGPSMRENPEAWSFDEENAESMGTTLQAYREFT